MGIFNVYGVRDMVNSHNLTGDDDGSIVGEKRTERTLNWGSVAEEGEEWRRIGWECEESGGGGGVLTVHSRERERNPNQNFSECEDSGFGM
ncbi:unnamed protein product [Camellia sinensis]